KRKYFKKERTQFVNSVIHEIHDLILENKETFKNQNKLSDLIKDAHPLKKRNNSNKSNLVFEIASINGVSVLFFFLSYELNKIIKSMPYIRDIEPDKKLKLKIPSYDVENSKSGLRNKKFNFINDPEIDKIHNHNKNIFNDNKVNIEKIKNEMGWKDVKIKKNLIFICL
ncbi:hypothetical protein BCR36DRAFT_444786, partial [Piromyces finnis]